MNQQSLPNDVVESWSTPWHELQKTLVEAFGGNAPIHPLAARKRAVASGRSNGGNWLLKARGSELRIVGEAR